MIKYEGTAFNQYDDPASGNAAANATITVRVKQTGQKVDLFSDNGITPIDNPFNVQGDGTYAFYTKDEFVNIILNEGQENQKTLSDVEIFSGLEKQQALMVYVTDHGAFNDPTDRDWETHKYRHLER